MSDFGGNSSGLQNPIFKIMCSGTKNLKNNNSNVTMMPNPMNLYNNNNLGESTMVDSSSVDMNNIDDMLNEISKSLMNLQTDINKVMMGINQINFLISKIQQFRANNSNLEMGSNLIKSNNMMNNNGKYDKSDEFEYEYEFRDNAYSIYDANSTFSEYGTYRAYNA